MNPSLITLIRVLQEYYIRHKWNGLALRTQSEREKLILCIIAAIERRVSHVSPIKPSIKIFLLCILVIML